MTGEHPLLSFAASQPRRDCTAADADLVYALGELRRELDSYTQSVVMGTTTPAENERMAALFEDFAGVIRVTVGTRQIGEAMGENGPDLR